MISFSHYIGQSSYLPSDTCGMLLKLDKEYGKLAYEYRECLMDAIKLVDNIEDEYERFMRCREEGKQYFPVLKHKKVTINSSFVARCTALIRRFEENKFLLSPLYIERLNIMKMNAQGHLNIHSKEGLKSIEYAVGDKISQSDYILALAMIGEHPYDDSDLHRDIDAETAKKEIQSHIDKRGFGWKVTLEDDMIPRMAVHPDGTLKIRKDAKFNEIDIEGLKCHEVDGHVARRYYGMQTGLFLFVYGAGNYGFYDEGIAVYNSTLMKQPKPNSMFNIALKTIIAYYILNKKMNFCEVFDAVLMLCNNFPPFALFKTLARFYRDVEDTSLNVICADDIWYFIGYNLVSDMTDQEREDALKINIGPNHKDLVSRVKEFLKLSNFEPITFDQLTYN